MNIRPRAGELCGGASQAHHPPTQARFARAYFLPRGCSCPCLTSRGLGSAKEHPSYAMYEPSRSRFCCRRGAAPITGPTPQRPRPDLDQQIDALGACLLALMAVVARCHRGSAMNGRADRQAPHAENIIL